VSRYEAGLVRAENDPPQMPDIHISPLLITQRYVEEDIDVNLHVDILDRDGKDMSCVNLRTAFEMVNHVYEAIQVTINSEGNRWSILLRKYMNFWKNFEQDRTFFKNQCLSREAWIHNVETLYITLPLLQPQTKSYDEFPIR
jgi:hypothetical protein